ncbi:FtsW/RodA/SpoVE family cell cycle protein [Bacillus sp. AK031]
MGGKRKQFLDDVLFHIKSTEAKSLVSRELNDHMDAEKKRLIEQGYADEAAEETAVKQMGNPAALGKDFNKIHKPKIDWWLSGLLLITIAFSILPMLTWNMEGAYFAKSKAIITLLGIGAAIGLMLIDYRKLFRYKWFFYGAGILILFMLITIPNQQINGVPMLAVGRLSIESIMALPFFYIAWSAIFAEKELKLVKAGALFIVPLLLFLAIGYLTTAFIYIIMVFTMIWWSSVKRRIISAFLAGIIIMGLLIMTRSLEYKERFVAFLNPEEYAKTSGYMYLRIKELISQAGWFGRFGETEFIPSAHTDFVFVSFTFQYGWLLAALLFATLLFLMMRMVLISIKVRDHFGKLLVIGGVSLFTVQFIYNIGMLMGFLPMLGISLPFISYGLMPTLLNSIIVGIVLSVYRRKDFVMATVN